MLDIERIVVGVDFSSYSDVARRQALKLAEATGAEVILHHACEDSDYQGQESWLLKSENFSDLLERGRESARRQLQQLINDARPAGVRVTAELSDLGPDLSLVEAAERHQADLVVIGTHGRTGLQRLRLARIAERVVRNSPCSVLVARSVRSPMAGFERLLVPTDFSDAANYALSVACSLGSEDSHIDVLHCWLTYFYATGYEGLYEDSVLLQPAMGEAVRQRGADLLLEYQNSRVNLCFEERYASPVGGIAEALEAKPYDMVVMGSHNRHGVKRFLLGSTAEAVVRQADCSVLVARKRSK